MAFITNPSRIEMQPHLPLTRFTRESGNGRRDTFTSLRATKSGATDLRARATVLFISIVAAVTVALVGCSSETAETDDFELTDERRASLSATAAAFQVQSIAEMDNSGSPISPPPLLPQFSLTHQTGESYGSADLVGKNVLLSFAYTHCPDVCPALFGHLIQVQEQMEDRIGNDLEIVIISVDPERDTPDWLHQRTTDMGGRWHFLTGSRNQLESVWADFGVRVEKQGEFVGHTGVTYLVSDDGLMTTRYPAYATFEHFIDGIESASVNG